MVALWGLIAAAVCARIVVAYATVGLPFDIDSMDLVSAALRDDPLHVYSATNQELAPRWPYLPGFFPWIYLAGVLDRDLGIPAHGTYQLPQILADAGVAALLFHYLGRRGESDRVRLGAAAIVLVGPTFAITSGYHGQIDSAAILPAVAALVLWEEARRPDRWLPVGGLLAIGTAIKTVPALVLFALLPSATSRGEAVRTTALALGLPALLLLPFLLAAGSDALQVTRNAGVPGFGGLSLVAQPNLPEVWLAGDATISLSTATQFLADASRYIAILTLVAVAALLFRYRPPAVQGAVLIWLAVYAFNPGIFPHYLVWGLPFFLMAGHFKQAVLVQLAILAPTLILHAAPWTTATAPRIYAAVMIALWAWSVVAFFAQARRIIRRGASGSPGLRPAQAGAAAQPQS